MTSRTFVESRDEMEDLLCEESVGYLGLSMDGQPYVVPLNYAYVENKILFHCALEGKKLDCIRANPQVCLNLNSTPSGGEVVIIEGHAEIVEEADLGRHQVGAFRGQRLPKAAGIQAAYHATGTKTDRGI